MSQRVFDVRSPAALVRSFTIDRTTLWFVTLVLVVQTTAIVAASLLTNVAWTAAAQQGDVELGVVFVGVLVLESVLIVLGWRHWNGLATRHRHAIRRAVFGSIGLGGAEVFSYTIVTLNRNDALLGTLVEVMIMVGVLGLLYRAMKRVRVHGMFWILFNCVGLALGIMVVATFGSMVAPVVIVPIMLLSLGWDVVAVKLSGVMDELVEFSSAATIPNHLIIPAQLRIDWTAVTSWLSDMDAREKPASVNGVIGVGDVAIPGIFTVSLWVAGTEHIALWAMVGTVLAIVVLRDTMSRTPGAVPGLPWLNTGALLGFIVGVLVTGTSISVALGM